MRNKQRLLLAALLVQLNPLYAFECGPTNTKYVPQLWKISSCRQEHENAAKAALPSYKQNAQSAQPKLIEGIRDSLEKAPQGANLGVLATSALNALVPGRFALFNNGGFGGPNEPNLGLFARVSGDEAADSIPMRSLVLQPAATLSPELVPPLAQALRDEGASQELRRLEDALDLSDALEVNLMLLSLGSNWRFGFGGGSERYGRLFAHIVQGALERGGTQFDDVYEGIELKVAEKLLAAEGAPCKPADGPKPSVRTLLAMPLADFASPCLSLLNDLLSRAAVEAAAPYQWVIDATGKARLHEFAELISNTSQLSARLRHIEADALVGTSASGLRIDWEISLSPSIESFLGSTLKELGVQGRNPDRRMDNICSEETPEGAAECFEGFLSWQNPKEGGDRREKAISHNRRIAISLEAMRLRPLDASVEVPLLGGGEGEEGGGLGGGLLDPLLPPILNPGGGGDGGATTREISVSAPAAYRYRIALRAGDTVWSSRQAGLGALSLRLEAGADYTHFDVEAQGDEVVRQNYWRWYLGPVLQIGRYAFPLTVGGQSRSEFEGASEAVDLGVLGGLQFRFL